MKIIEYGKENSEVIMLLHDGGLSLGGQVGVKMLSRRSNICKFAFIESALVVPMKFTASLIAPTFGMRYGLKLQVLNRYYHGEFSLNHPKECVDLLTGSFSSV